jgi:transcriptional regulator with XRE-family HTH domain
VNPDEIKTLRRELGCSAKELAAALGVDQATVFAWERRELFPTKQYVDRMLALRAGGPSAIPRASKKTARVLSPKESRPIDAAALLEGLTDPRLGEILRKLLAHGALREEVARIAQRYSDPVSSSARGSSPASSAPETGAASREVSVASSSGEETRGEG